MITVSEAHQKFVDHLKSQSRSSATVLAYGKDIEQLKEFLKKAEKEHVHEVSVKDLRNFMSKLSNEGYTPKSISRKTNSTKTFFRFLKINEYITDDPALLLEHPKFDVKPPRILSKIEYRALRDAARNDNRTSAIIEALLQTGIRIGELANLNLEEIKWGQGNKSGELFIRAQESHSERFVPLNKAAEAALKRYLETRPNGKEQRVFITKTGRPLLVRNIRTAIDRYFRIAGIKDAKVNDLRHTFVAHHLMMGASLVVVSKLAGHKRLATTEKYLELIKERPEEPVRLEEL
ncbi:MAG: tyrosine-type recombinase/integrase [Patescibacteria group bacterium]|nr:tyrosine-type recombinase/integrase [Patescibacteria group bacterium]